MVVNIKFFGKEMDEILEPTNAAWVSRILSLMILVVATLWRRCILSKCNIRLDNQDRAVNPVSPDACNRI